MLREENRLKKTRDFNLLLKQGVFVRGNFVDLKYLRLLSVKNPPKNMEEAEFRNQLRIALAVGLKISGSAVKRNAVRRRLSEILRLLIKEKKTRDGFYILVMPRKEIVSKDYDTVNQEVGKIFKQAGLLV